jgi:hypothetical protein
MLLFLLVRLPLAPEFFVKVAEAVELLLVLEQLSLTP